MRQDKTTGTVKPVPVVYAVLCVGRILSLSRTSFYDPVCCFVFFFAVVTEAISFLLITLQFSEFHIARDSKHTVSTCVDFILHSFLSRPSYPTVFYKYVLQTKVPKIFLMLLPERTKLLHCSRLLLLKQLLQNPLQEDRLY